MVEVVESCTEAMGCWETSGGRARARGGRQSLTFSSLRARARLRESRRLKPKFLSCSGSVTTYPSGGKKQPALRD